MTKKSSSKSAKPTRSTRRATATPQTRVSRKSTPPTRRARVWRATRSVVTRVRGRIDGLKSRRPHRSFRRTRRRDYVRSLQLPGYFELTMQVTAKLWHNRALFIGMMIVYAFMIFLTGAAITQSSYTETQDALKTAGGDLMSANLAGFFQSSTLFAASVMDIFDPSRMDSTQQFYLIIFSILTWLTTVWLLRAIMSGKRPRLRDGLYNAGAPLLSTFFILLLLLIQLLPIAAALLLYSVLDGVEMLNNGFELMLFHTTAAVLTTLSLYWATSTVIALVVVTLPGMYPMQAIRTSGDLVIGRRLRVLLRLLWAGFLVLGMWLLLGIPAFMFDGWLKETWPALSWIPIVPTVLMLLITTTIIWCSAYVYVFYRGLIDDGAKPA